MHDTPRLKVALTTVCAGQSRFRCGLLLWCQTAERLSQSLSSFADTEVVLIGREQRANSDDCPSASTVWNDELADAATDWLARVVKKKDPWFHPLIMKVLGLTLIAHDIVVYADLDVILLPPGAGAHVPSWRASLRSFMASDATFVGAPDHSAPINTGVWLAKPRARWLREALRVLRTCNWSRALGYCDVGRPATIDAVNGTRLVAQLARGHAAGAPDQVRAQVRRKLKLSEYARKA
jgi:hypothetical protein